MRKLYFLLFLIASTFVLKAQYTWTNKTEFPDSGRCNGASFTINGKGYMIGGTTANNIYFSQVWEYTPTSDTWKRKADFPTTMAGTDITFVINGKGYVVGGAYTYGGSYYSSTYEYDPGQDSWTLKSPFPENGVSSCFHFVINNIAYVGAGIRNSNVHGVVSCYSYNPVTDTWASIANYPGNPSIGTGGFAIDTFGYAGLGGTGNNIFYTDFFRYSPSSNSWSRMATFPGKGRFVDLGGFTLNGKGIIGCGSTDLNGSSTITYDLGDFYEYAADSNKWSAISGISGLPRFGPCSFVLSDTAYIVGGYIHDGATTTRLVSQLTVGTSNDTTHVIVYDTLHISDTTYVSISVTDTLFIQTKLTGVQSPNNFNTIRAYPNPAKDHLVIDNGNYAAMSGYKLKITNVLGQDVFSSPINSQQFDIDLSTWGGAGTYVVYVVDPNFQIVATKLIIIQ